MSTLAYIAGASVERNINEAIRVEEARSHGAELRNLSYRFQTKINELYEENKGLREFLDLKDVIIGQQAATIDIQKKKIVELESKIDGSKRFAMKQNDIISSYDMMKMIMTKEVDTLIGTSLPEIIASVFERNGVSLDQETQDYIKSQANLVLRFSGDPSIRPKFYLAFRDALLKARQPGEKPWTYTEIVDCAIDIAKEVLSQSDSVAKASAGNASFAANKAKKHAKLDVNEKG